MDVVRDTQHMAHELTRKRTAIRKTGPIKHAWMGAASIINISIHHPQASIFITFMMYSFAMVKQCWKS